MIGNTSVLHKTFYSLLFWFIPFQIQGLAEEISGCYGDTVTISCGSGDKKINILGDFYGLSPPDADPKSCAYSDNDICVVPSHSHSSVTKQVCNGRTNCIFTISERHKCMNTVQETTYQQIKYECIPATDIHSMCANAEWSGVSGFLTSANYPIFYPPRADCTCILKTEDASFILLKTAELRLKSSTPCRDYLRVEPESNPEEVLCGSVHRIYEARSFRLYFHTQLTSYKGFLLSYQAASNVNVRCFNGPPVAPTTPSTTTKGNSNLPTPEIRHDVVSLPPMDSDMRGVFPEETENAETGIRVGTQAAEKDGTPKPSTGNNEDAIVVETSPSTKYPLSRLSPSIKAPVKSSLHTVSGCFGDIVHFQCKGGEMIRVVKDMYGSAPTGRCLYEEGDCTVSAEGQKSIVTQICSSKTRCMNFIVTRTFCGERVTSYQEITYECVPATAITNICAETVLNSEDGFLASPNFPGMYPRNTSCSCTLKAAEDAPSSTVHIKLAHFALHDLQGCGDWLEVDVGDGSTPKTLCGSQHGQFTGTNVRLSFRSDAKYSHSGFWIHFKGENASNIVMACNVPVDLVWPNYATIPTLTMAKSSTTPLGSVMGRTEEGSLLRNGTDALPPVNDSGFFNDSSNATTAYYLAPPLPHDLSKVTEPTISGGDHLDEIKDIENNITGNSTIFNPEPMGEKDNITADAGEYWQEGLSVEDDDIGILQDSITEDEKAISVQQPEVKEMPLPVTESYTKSAMTTKLYDKKHVSSASLPQSPAIKDLWLCTVILATLLG